MRHPYESQSHGHFTDANIKRQNLHFMMYIFVIYMIYNMFMYFIIQTVYVLYIDNTYMYLMNILYINLYMTCIHNVCQIFVINHRQNV